MLQERIFEIVKTKASESQEFQGLQKKLLLRLTFSSRSSFHLRIAWRWKSSWFLQH
jgi:hypothetical protein